MLEGVKRRRSFLEAFKREAVVAIQGDRSVSQVAAELGLPDRLVRSWLRWSEGRPAEATVAPAPTPRRAQAAPARRVGPSPGDQAAEIARLRKELARARPDGARHLKASGAHLRPDDGPEVSYMFIQANVAGFPSRLCARCSASAAAATMAGRAGPRARGPRADRALAAEIRTAHAASWPLWQPAGACRIARPWPPGRPQARRAPDARHGPGSPAQAPVPSHDGQPARLPDRAEHARTELQRGSAGPRLAGRPDLHLDRRGMAVSRRGARPLHPPRGRLGDGRPPRA